MYKSKVDWYYIEDSSDYPGPKGRVVPYDEEIETGYDDPKGFEDEEGNIVPYKGTELYIPKGTKGNKEGNSFVTDEGNDVPFEEKYFEQLNLKEARMSKEFLRMQMLAGIITESEYKAKLNETTDWESLNKSVKELSKQVIRPDLYENNFNIWEMALFYDYDEAVNNDFIEADEISKEEFNDLHNKLDDNYNFNYFVRNWTVLDDEESRHEEDMNN